MVPDPARRIGWVAGSRRAGKWWLTGTRLAFGFARRTAVAGPCAVPALRSQAEDSRAAERQRSSGRGPRARERRLQARLAQLPMPTNPTAAACARRAFRGTRVVARRNALLRFVVDHTVRPSPAVPSREGTPTGHDQHQRPARNLPSALGRSLHPSGAVSAPILPGQPRTVFQKGGQQLTTD